FRTQPRSATDGTQGISAIPAEKHADVQLVFLALQVGKEAAYSPEAIISLEDGLLLLARELVPGNVQWYACLTRIALQFGEKRTVFGLSPGLDGALRQSFRFVGNDQVNVEI